MCLGGLGSVGLWVQAAQSSQVVQLAHDVHRGEVIDAEDLVVATVGRAPGGSTVASRDLAQLIGQEALIDLRGGALLPPGAVGKSIVEPNQVLVGLRLAPGRIPAKGLDVGSRVLLVAVPGTSAQAEKTDATFRARVVTASSAQPDGYLVLDVAIDAGEVQKVARLAATDQLTLVREADR